MAIMKGYYSEFSNWDFQTLKDAEDAELIAATNAQKLGEVYWPPVSGQQIRLSVIME